MYPEDLLYTPEHEWIRVEADGTVVFGITSFAQDALGDIVYVSLPAIGDELVGGQSCGEVESTKSVSEIYAPIDGSVLERNEGLDTATESINNDPYGDGWMVRMRPAAPEQAQALMSAAEYAALIAAG